MAEFGASCHRNFSSGELNAIFYTRIGVATFAFAACLLVFTLLCTLVCCLRVWKTFVHRLKLYLMAVATVLSVLYLVQVLPVKFDTSTDGDAWSATCKPIIFFQMCADWTLLLLICWLVVYLYRLARCIGKPLTIFPVHDQILFEAVGIAITFTLPLLFLWIPFVTDSYGVAGGLKWCAVVIKRNCHSTGEGLGMLIGLWYLPAAIVALICTIGIVITVIFFWKYYNQQGLTYHMSQALMQGIPPVTYLVLYNTINCIDVSSVIYHNSNRKSWKLSTDYHLWMTHAVTGPSRALVIPFAFVLSQALIRCCSTTQRKNRDSYNRL